MSDEQQIRDLIEGWAAAIRAGDLAAVTKDRTDDVVMFDVPPPERGARGAEEYARLWPPFFEYIATGAVFEIDELQVRAGEGVGWALALLRCGTPDELAAEPERRLRLTIGLVHTGGRWQVQHEHHSFTQR